MWRQLDVRLSDSARKCFSDYLERSHLDGPVITILWANDDDEPNARWMYAAYDRDGMEELRTVMAKTGAHFLYTIEGFKVIIIQPELIARLEGSLLTIEDGALAVVP